MQETITEFMDRIYVDFVNDKVIVYPSKYRKEEINGTYKPEIWTIETAKNYLNWLEKNKVIQVEL